jgi:hypothetical protein
METQLFQSLVESRKQQNLTDDSEPSYVYLGNNFVNISFMIDNVHSKSMTASDNEDVKDNFTAILEADHKSHHNFTLRIMRVETQFIQHVKSLDKMKAATNNEGRSHTMITDVVADQIYVRQV